MKSILEDIKNGALKQVYLLYGEETYLIKQYRDKIKEAFFPVPDTMNCSYFGGKDVPVLEIKSLSETLPFFAQRRLLIIENSGLFKHGGEELADYMKNLPQSSFFLFSEQEVDKRSRLFKSVKDTGRAVEFARQDEDTLRRWIQGMLKRENKEIAASTLALFMEKTGNDMGNIRNELEKLICYTMQKSQIDSEDLERICTRVIQNQIFEMVSAISSKQQKKALDLYYDLLSLKEPPLRILFLVARQFNLLLQVKDAKKRGYDNKKIAEKTGLHSFVAGKYVAQIGKFQESYLKEALKDCVEMEESVKTGKINDKMSVEMIIVKYSS